MPRIYMCFEWLAGWRVSFLDGEETLPRTLLFQSGDKLVEMAEKGGAMKSLADRQGLEYAVRLGRGGLYLDLSYAQLATLQRSRA
ncbi:MAG: hypothetical protein ACRYFU_21365 [Janthinobacterium lividum]